MKCQGYKDRQCNNLPRLGEIMCGVCLELLKDNNVQLDYIDELIEAIFEKDKSLATYCLRELFKLEPK